MKFCKDCKHLVDKTPKPSKWGFPRLTIAYDYLFCDKEHARDSVTGALGYAHLERIGKCGEEGIYWEPRDALDTQAKDKSE